ncbi:MAG TPA: hypothetical protein VMF05_09420 [Stellaceae bacterium]|nr:hypothetical protein [Stellaceae bacterium]
MPEPLSVTRAPVAAPPDTVDQPAGQFAPARLPTAHGPSAHGPSAHGQGSGGEIALLAEPHPLWRPQPQRRRLSYGWISFILLVILPVTISAIYYFLIAADQYVAEFRFGLRSAEPVLTTPGTFLQPGVGRLQIGVDSYAVVQYIRSRAIIDDLDKTIDLSRLFSPPTADWLSRLHPPVPIEALVTYWRGQVDAFFDPTNGTIVVRARAFTPHDALALARGILASSEALVNGLSARARLDAVRNSKDEVRVAEHRLSIALRQLRDYRDQQGLIDPRQSANASAGLADRLRDEIVGANTELATLKEFERDDAPAVQVLEARIRSIAAQQQAIASEVTETAKTRTQALSQVMGSYDELEDERRFAESAYQHALEGLDRARINADRQQIYVADFVPPSLPEEALYPHRWSALAVTFLIAFTVWAIGGLAVRSVRDHLL